MAGDLCLRKQHESKYVFLLNFSNLFLSAIQLFAEMHKKETQFGFTVVPLFFFLFVFCFLCPSRTYTPIATVIFSTRAFSSNYNFRQCLKIDEIEIAVSLCLSFFYFILGDIFTFFIFKTEIFPKSIFCTYLGVCVCGISAQCSLSCGKLMALCDSTRRQTKNIVCFCCRVAIETCGMPRNKQAIERTSCASRFVSWYLKVVNFKGKGGGNIQQNRQHCAKLFRPYIFGS